MKSRPLRNVQLRGIILIALLALPACKVNPASAPKTSVAEVIGSSKKRVAEVSAILAKAKTPPTAILDAYFLEEQIGDGVLGPSDFRAFYAIKVARLNLAQWTKDLTPLGTTAEYAAPAKPRDWWIARDVFSSLQFYKPDALTGRVNGWVGVSQQTGQIYIFTFTM